MNRAAIRLEHLPADVLGLSPQASAALAGRPRTSALPGMVLPADVAGFPTPADRLEDEDRRALARLLERELRRFSPHDFVLEAARALARPGAALVVTGQQPAFLGGPLYDVYKAVHVIRLARALSEAWRVPVLPAFWNHADDHDIAEVHHLWLQNANLDLFKLSLASMSSGRVPFSEIEFDEDRHRLGAVREVLRQSLWDGERRDAALALFVPRHGETFASAFTRILLSLFGHHGLLVIESGWLRGSISRVLAEVVTLDLPLAWAEGAERLRAAGQEPAIEAETAALLFRHAGGERRALRLAPGGFRFDGEPGTRTAAELAAELLQEPAAWSPAALLRPIAQDRVLPVAAYVGGWGELAYHAQLPPLRERAGMAATPFVPRLSATLVDPEVRVALEKLEIGVADVLRARGRLGESEGADEASPVLERLREVGRGAARELEELREDLARLDRGLAAQLRRLGEQIRDLVDRLAGKAERVHANACGRGRRHFRRLNHGLFPRGEPQERVRGLVEFAARFGTGWLDELIEEIEPLPTEHVVIHLEDPRKTGAGE
ncbi:MAG: bacillithiol biosynthesis cysteine-adding enzyme BshC [Planctomycetota bacterium]